MANWQIGENIVRLSEDFRRTYDEIPWREIKNFRNSTIHGYEVLKLDILYSAITNTIPVLEKYCEEQLTKIITQQASEETGPKTPRPRF